jgi:signal transduction histidine kinase
MTPVQQSQLFTRFYRANPEGNIVGTGLGLCFVKDILELHCGGVEVHSAKGEGTQVTLWLPSVDNATLH